MPHSALGRDSGEEVLSIPCECGAAFVVHPRSAIALYPPQRIGAPGRRTIPNGGGAHFAFVCDCMYKSPSALTVSQLYWSSVSPSAAEIKYSFKVKKKVVAVSTEPYRGARGSSSRTPTKGVSRSI